MRTFSFAFRIIRKAVLERDRYICQYCGSNYNLEVDHVWPVCKGGTDRMSNLVACCASCNSKKSGKTLREWVEAETATRVINNSSLGSPRGKETELLFTKIFGIWPESKLIAFLNAINNGATVSQGNWVGSKKMLGRGEFDAAIGKLLELGILEWKNEEHHPQGVRFSDSGHERLNLVLTQILERKHD